MWKLAQKFSSLNPDLDKLQKIKWVICCICNDILDMQSYTFYIYCFSHWGEINKEVSYFLLECLEIWPVRIFVASCRAFTITAVAQLCLLGTMWIFGCFQFNKGTIVMSYLFTIFGSIQGIMLFVMHCLFSKQVSHTPLKKSKEQALLLFCVKTHMCSDLGEGGIWKHPVQIPCTLEEELLRFQLLTHQQSSSKQLFISSQCLWFRRVRQEAKLYYPIKLQHTHSFYENATQNVLNYMLFIYSVFWLPHLVL